MGIRLQPPVAASNWKPIIWWPEPRGMGSPYLAIERSGAPIVGASVLRDEGLVQRGTLTPHSEVPSGLGFIV